METTMQNVTVNSPATFHFKSHALNAYSKQIAEIGKDMASKNVELAKILGRIKAEEAYKEDGFKSVAEYAETTFGIKKSSAYQLANVGERFFNTGSETAKKVTAMLTPSNMAELVKMDDSAIEKAITDGKISSASTQKELRDIATASKEAKNPKVTVEKSYKVAVTAVTASNEIRTQAFPKTTLAFIRDGLLVKEWGFSDVQEKRFSGDKEDGTILFLSADGAFAKVTYANVEHQPQPAKKRPHFTYAEIMEMLKASAEENGMDIAKAMAELEKAGE